MDLRKSFLCFSLLFISVACMSQASQKASGAMRLNDLEYLEYGSVNVMLAHDFYPESHQGGVGVIQNGLRTATNGDIRLEPTPGQWQPTPAVGKRMVDKTKGEVSVRYEFPNEEINRKGFNPIIYPDLHFAYTTRIVPAGKGFRIIVDLEKPLPDEWIGKVGFNFELFPGILFGKSYYMDQQHGIFTRQPNGPNYKDKDGELQIAPMAKGRRLTVAPESDRQRMMIENMGDGPLELIDGRGKHNNGWFVVRSLVPKGAAKNAIEWLVTPNAIEGWRHEPVIQLSQVGYHPKQQKIAIIETDAKDNAVQQALLLRVKESGGFETALQAAPKKWGKFLRYNYLQFDFTKIEKPGMYLVKYGKYQTEPFQINAEVYKRHVWQPTLEYFLPAQMCHVRVNERYRTWHGLCHLDDARMAPVNHNHFDGYISGTSTLTRFKAGDNVPFLDYGGWHDAGDFDMRVESQAETIHGLTLAIEHFGLKYDNTMVDQKNRLVEIQVPDGKSDALQQIEHGLLSVVGGYRAMGRFYRGIIEPDLKQYVLLGDVVNQTDNVPFKTASENANTPAIGLPGAPDDRWVFTEDNPGRELNTAAALAAASRVLKGYNDTLAAQCLQIAQEIWDVTKERSPMQKVELAVELLRTTSEKKYADFLISQTEGIVKGFENIGWVVARSLKDVNDAKYRSSITEAAKTFFAKIQEQGKKTPYGVPYEPHIWGAGWGIQNFGFRQYFLHTAFPDIFPVDYMLHSLNFVLGAHPGTNTASFASGVGSNSLTTAYGFNRADWSYIPGGVGSGTALIRPDFPELLHWPFLWQQTEYVLGGGTTDYLFLVLAADHLLNKK